MREVAIAQLLRFFDQEKNEEPVRLEDIEQEEKINTDLLSFCGNKRTSI